LPDHAVSTRETEHAGQKFD